MSFRSDKKGSSFDRTHVGFTALTCVERRVTCLRVVQVIDCLIDWFLLWSVDTTERGLVSQQLVLNIKPKAHGHVGTDQNNRIEHRILFEVGEKPQPGYICAPCSLIHKKNMNHVLVCATRKKKIYLFMLWASASEFIRIKLPHVESSNVLWVRY